MICFKYLNNAKQKKTFQGYNYIYILKTENILNLNIKVLIKDRSVGLDDDALGNEEAGRVRLRDFGLRTGREGQRTGCGKEERFHHRVSSCRPVVFQPAATVPSQPHCLPLFCVSSQPCSGAKYSSTAEPSSCSPPVSSFSVFGHGWLEPRCIIAQ